MTTLNVGGIQVPMKEYEVEVACNCGECYRSVSGRVDYCWAEWHSLYAATERDALEMLEMIAEELGGICIGRVEEVE